VNGGQHGWEFEPLPGDKAETQVRNAGQGLLPAETPGGGHQKPKTRPSDSAALGFGGTKPDLIRSGTLRTRVAAQPYIESNEQQGTSSADRLHN